MAYFVPMSAPPPPLLKKNYFQLYQKNSNFTSIKFIQECCIKLEGEFLLFF